MGVERPGDSPALTHEMDADSLTIWNRSRRLGIELDEDQIKDKIGHDWKNPETYNFLDKSVVDW